MYFFFLKEFFSLLYEVFLRPLLTYASPKCFPFLSVTNITKLEHLHRAASRETSGCLSSSSISLFLSETSLIPLRVTSTYFALSFYERALRLPTSFPISGLTRLEVKPRLGRSSRRAFAYTHPTMLPSTCPREAFLICPPSPQNLPSFTVESTLSSPCLGAPLAYLDSLPPYRLVLWTESSFLSFWHTFSFLVGPICSSFSAEACAILHALCWSLQHQQVCLFSSSSDSCSVFATLSPPSFLLSQSLWQIWHELSSVFSCSIRLQWVPGPSSLLGNDSANELTRREALLAFSVIPCSLSCPLFSDWRRTVSSKFFDTQVPSIATEELVLPRHARCVLSRILPATLVDTSDLILHCPATNSLLRSLFGDSLSLYDDWFLDSRPASGAPWFSAMPPSLEWGRITTTYRYSAEFCSLASTNSDFELTLTLIISVDLLSVLTTPIAG